MCIGLNPLSHNLAIQLYIYVYLYTHMHAFFVDLVVAMILNASYKLKKWYNDYIFALEQIGKKYIYCKKKGNV